MGPWPRPLYSSTVRSSAYFKLFVRHIDCENSTMIAILIDGSEGGKAHGQYGEQGPCRHRPNELMGVRR